MPTSDERLFERRRQPAIPQRTAREESEYRQEHRKKDTRDRDGYPEGPVVSTGWEDK
jgi:hypothetical protein